MEIKVKDLFCQTNSIRYINPSPLMNIKGDSTRLDWLFILQQNQSACIKHKLVIKTNDHAKQCDDEKILFFITLTQMQLACVCVCACAMGIY